MTSRSVGALLTSSRRAVSATRVARRTFATTSPSSFPSGSSPPPRPLPRKREDKFNYNPVPSFSATPDAENIRFRRVTANDLESHRTPPTRVNMLVRDFIEDSLYNPNYGYFPKQVNIFTAKDSRIDFRAMRDGVEFQEEVATRYAKYGPDAQDGPGRQIWHTPTELFQPYYGHALARCLVAEYLLKYFPYEDLVIYEIGAGNGTLAVNILDFLRAEYPEVYDRTRYHVIEISGNLAELQKKRLQDHACATVMHKSVFHWDKREPAPCFFVAMEVVDNFAHDLIRYDMKTLEPYQAIVSIDSNGEFSMHYTRVTDPLIRNFLSLRRHLDHRLPVPSLLRSSPRLRSAFASLPFAPNLSTPEYIPTRLLSLLQILRRHFPRHRLLLSDFSSLPDTVKPGINAPVVQTRYQNTTVPCTTLLVQQGYFDIFFPTDFERLRDMYEAVLALGSPSQVLAEDGEVRPSPLGDSATQLGLGGNFFSAYHPSNRRAPIDGTVSTTGLPVGSRKSNVYSHQEFMETYADLSMTRLKNGENPLLEFYQNVKFLF